MDSNKTLLEQTFQVSLESAHFAFRVANTKFNAMPDDCGRIYSRLCMGGAFLVDYGGGDASDRFDAYKEDIMSGDEPAFANVVEICKNSYLADRKRLKGLPLEELIKNYVRMSALGLAYLREKIDGDDGEIATNCLNAYKLSACCVFSILSYCLGPEKATRLCDEALVSLIEEESVKTSYLKDIFDWTDLPEDYQQRGVWPQKTVGYPFNPSSN
jgi:hypothetical protein